MNQLTSVATPLVPALVAAGFRHMGCWRLNAAGDGIELNFKAEPEPGVYAYAVNGVVKYVGSAQRGLRGRFRRYAITKTMRTSARIRDEIIKCLKRGETVDVLALSPPAFDWCGLPVDLIAGLEEGLIRALNGTGLWNIRSNRSSS